MVGLGVVFVAVVGDLVLTFEVVVVLETREGEGVADVGHAATTGWRNRINIYRDSDAIILGTREKLISPTRHNYNKQKRRTGLCISRIMIAKSYCCVLELFQIQLWKVASVESFGFSCVQVIFKPWPFPFG